MHQYTVDDGVEEVNHSEATVLSVVQMYLKERNIIEVAKLLAVVNKELYRIDEEARRLRLSGELRDDIYGRLVFEYKNIASNITHAA